MRVLFLTQYGEQGSTSRTRVYQYLPHLRRAGVAYRVVIASEDTLYRGALLRGQQPGWHHLPYLIASWLVTCVRSVEAVLRAPRYDVVFVQRVLPPLGLVWLLTRMNSRIVFDFDDALFEQKHEAKGGCWDRLAGHRSARALPDMLRVARWVIVENDHNRKYVLNHASNVAIITGPIDTDHYQPDHRMIGASSQRGRVLGWIGSPGTTKYLHGIRGALSALSERYGDLSLMLIGASPFEIRGMRVIQKPWGLDTEVENLRQFDIGIMPLPDTPWTRGKGGYKLLQYMAMGIPAVASPVGINRKIIQDGVNGFLAASEKEWMEKLSLLIERPDLRRRFAEEGRRTVETRYSVRANFPRLLEILNEVAHGGPS